MSDLRDTRPILRGRRARGTIERGLPPGYSVAAAVKELFDQAEYDRIDSRHIDLASIRVSTEDDGTIVATARLGSLATEPEYPGQPEPRYPCCGQLAGRPPTDYCPTPAAHASTFADLLLNHPQDGH